MDANYFLKKRTQYIRFYHEAAGKPFEEIKQAIENGLPPFDNPPYNEDPEPAFLEEWMDAHTAIEILGLSCVSLLSDTLKLYFQALQHRVIWFSFKEGKGAFKQGFVAAYLGALRDIVDTDWTDCPADLDVIEQIVLARNRAQHGDYLSSFDVTHDPTMLKKHPNLFFATEEESKRWAESEESASAFMMPTLHVTRSKLFSALEEVEKLADYIERRLDKAWSWRARS